MSIATIDFGPAPLKLDSLRRTLLAMPGVVEEMPFGPSALVYKILAMKMFALISWNEQPLRINLKCDPTYALFLREQYAAITPGYHMNKQHWNSITLDGTVAPAKLMALIEDSYQLVVQKMTRKDRQRLLYLSSS